MNTSILYYFGNEKLSIFEYKVVSDKGEFYQWFLKENNSENLKTLKFKSLSEEVVNNNLINIRVFEDSELRFDKLFAKFSWAGDFTVLEAKEANSLESSLKEMAVEYLKVTYTNK